MQKIKVMKIAFIKVKIVGLFITLQNLWKEQMKLRKR